MVPTLSDYLTQAAAGMTRDQFTQLIGLRARLLDKAAAAPVGRHPRLERQARFVCEWLGHAAPLPDVLPPAWCEIAAAAWYLLKGVDQIPDSVEEIGFDDDALILDLAFSRNRAAVEELARHPALASFTPVSSLVPGLAQS